jgi:hypothetical protein
MVDEPKQEKTGDPQVARKERATEGAKAMSEYMAEREAERAKTVRLRALRLAKEVADKAAIHEIAAETAKQPTKAKARKSARSMR